MRMRGLPCCVKCHTCQNTKSVKRVFGSALLQQTTRALLPGGGNSPRSINLLVFTYVQ